MTEPSLWAVVRSPKGIVGLLIGMALLIALIWWSGALAPSADATTAIRGVYGSDQSSDGVSDIAELGFNTVNVTMFEAERLDNLHRNGMKAVVWLGASSRTTCEWEFSDSEVEDAIEKIAGHPAIVAYQIGDEPGYSRVGNCPDIVERYRERHDVVKGVDPTKPTYTVLAAFNGVEEFPYQYWEGVLDVYGINVYPCSYQWGQCRFGLIDQAIDELEKDGIDRYWAVIQDFDDGWYRTPTAGEVAEQLSRWDKSDHEGYFVYDWDLTDIETNTEKQAVYREHNALAPEPVEPPPDFIDIADSVHANDIRSIALAGITLGCNPPRNTRFCPDDPISRGEMAAFLTRGLGLLPMDGDLFRDDDRSVFESEIDSVAGVGIARGCDPPANHRFCPDDLVTRGQMAAFLVRSFGFTAGEGYDIFTDDDASVFEADIDRLASADVTVGCSRNRFCPESAVTRAQMASFLKRAFQLPSVQLPNE